MKTVLTLSPHLDDAAFSVGPLLAEIATSARVIVATVFTQSVTDPSGFALACQLDKGLALDVDYMKLRRDEDKEWAKIIGAEFVHGRFMEAPHRGYHSPIELFGPILESDKIKLSLTRWLDEIIDLFTPDLILIPLGIGGHVDHQLVREIAAEAMADRATFVFFKDQPYSWKSNDDSLKDMLSDLNPSFDLGISFHQNSIERAVEAAGSYKTQIPFQFGDFQSMRRILGSAWGRRIPLFFTSAESGFLADFELAKSLESCRV